MRHGKKFNHLGRKADHRNAMLSNLAISLIMSKRIETTVAKAKALRKYVEPILTRSKEDNYDNRKVIFKALNNKEGIKELYNVVSDRIANRPGGYTRIIKLGTRLGDSADMCLIELVDFNETLLQAAEEKATTKTRRSRRGSGGSGGAGTETSAAVVNADGSSAEVVTDELPTETATAVETDAVMADATSTDSVGETTADDLTKIEGIGPKIAELLNNAGISTFAQLATAEDAVVQQVLADAGSSFNMHDATTWNEQAALARDGKWDELDEMQNRLKGGKE